MKKHLLALVLSVLLPGPVLADDVQGISYNSSTGKLQFNTRAGGAVNVPALSGSSIGNTGISIVASGTGGSATNGSFNTCAAPGGVTTDISYVKFSDGRMLTYGHAWLLTNSSNATCSTSIAITLPVAYTGLWSFPSCSAGGRNASSSAISYGMNCKVVSQLLTNTPVSLTTPAGSSLIIMATDPQAYAGGNFQAIDFFFQVWGTY
jgi:hypothetical protein